MPIHDTMMRQRTTLTKITIKLGYLKEERRRWLGKTYRDRCMGVPKVESKKNPKGRPECQHVVGVIQADRTDTKLGLIGRMPRLQVLFEIRLYTVPTELR